MECASQRNGNGVKAHQVTTQTQPTYQLKKRFFERKQRKNVAVVGNIARGGWDNNATVGEERVLNKRSKSWGTKPEAQ
ncbi:hypothetical protein FOXB_05207 [Fusarium oxysporum f. sp. conglutinans Fo5176]|uniref:Uncharacterized protein n=1 Tax=Fusarium oxysporum (strain Fo5176) TaxID=660025 RepID=F9FFM8_FUSOF|nr:hypothetical protein FOXB_05207 [Fusarium oxysporum f. sp. conglutinans Fo5176]